MGTRGRPTNHAARGAVLGVLAAGLLALALESCREPTEIAVLLTTDLPCEGFAGALVMTGVPGELEDASPVASVEPAMCQSGKLGSLVLVPSGDARARVGLRVVGARAGSDPRACAAHPADPHCITARRSLRYVPHTPLNVPIELQAACAGIACAPDATCVDGACRSAEIDPDTMCPGDTCGLADADAGADATLPVATEGDMSGLQANAPWPMRHRSPKQTGRSPYRGPADGGSGVILLDDAGGSIETAPIIAADGTVYVSSGQGLLALSGGTVTWSQSVAPVPGAVAIGVDGTVYVGFQNGPYSALRPDGGPLWALDAGATRVVASPAIAPDRTVYFARADDGEVLAAAPDGTVKWRLAPDGGSFWSSPALGDDGTIYIGSTFGSAAPALGLYAIRPDGTERWFLPLAGGVFNVPAIGVDGTIYAPADDGWLYAVRPDGTVAWRFDCGGGAGNQCGVTPSIAADGEIYVVTRNQDGGADNHVYGIHPDGGTAWDSRIGIGSEGSPALDANGFLYLGQMDGTFVVIDARSGALRWQAHVAGVRGSLYAVSIAADGTAYAGTSGGQIVAFRR